MSDTGNGEGGGRKRGHGPKGPGKGRPTGGRGRAPSRGAGKPFEGKDGGRGESKPFAKRFRKEGEEAGSAERPRKPFVKREASGQGEEQKSFRPRREAGERGGQDFGRREDRPRGGEGGERPARSSGKPFRRREDASEGGGEARPRPARDDRPDGDGERKPFRPFAGERGEGGRPRAVRRDRAEAGEDASGGERPFRKPFAGKRNEGGFTPRSRGMYSHGGRDEKGEERRPRSYGRLSHEGGDVRREERPKRGPRAEGERREFGAGREGRRERPSPAGRDGDAAPRRSPRGTRPQGDRIGAGEGVGTMRIAKRLARAGISSRRDAEGMIADGRVKLNGVVLESPAVEVSASDRIEIDGQPIPAIERTRLWLFHKSAGLVTTNRDPEGRPTVFDRLPEDMPRVLSVGRLDINTEGLLLLTNDGGLARILELPSTGWLRRYRVRAHGEISQEKLDELRQGIAVDGVFYGAIEASLDRTQGSNVWLTLGLREGKNREVKRVLGHLGLEVNRLIRISFGPFQLGELEAGAVQEIKGRMLRDQLSDRLIEEAGADFDAPIVNPFSNRPVAAERRPREGGDDKPRKRGDWISASEVKPNRKKFGAAKREEALGRLDTRAPKRFERGAEGEGRGEERRPRPERSDKRPFGEKKPRSFDKGARDEEGDEKRPARRPAGAPKRTANVWMAPGARALGEKKRAERDERDRAREDGAPRRSSPRGGPKRGGGGTRPEGPQRPPRRPKG